MDKITISWDELPEVEKTQQTQISSDKIVITFDELDEFVVPVDVPPKQFVIYPYPQPPAGKLPPRMKRLYADAKSVAEVLSKSQYIRIAEMRGNPSDYYRIEYNIRGIESVRGHNVNYRHTHEIELQLTSDYPQQQPKCTMLTPIFHPNIAPSRICIGDHWTAGEKLVDLIIRIGEIIAYQSYNIRSPLDGDAARWADEHESLLPTDKADLIPPE
jgi:ubiquitin-protein ligase